MNLAWVGGSGEGRKEGGKEAGRKGGRDKNTRQGRRMAATREGRHKNKASVRQAGPSQLCSGPPPDPPPKKKHQLFVTSSSFPLAQKSSLVVGFACVFPHKTKKIISLSSTTKSSKCRRLFSGEVPLKLPLGHRMERDLGWTQGRHKPCSNCASLSRFSLLPRLPQAAASKRQLEELESLWAPHAACGAPTTCDRCTRPHVQVGRARCLL